MEIRGLKEKLAQITTASPLTVSSLAVNHAMTVERAWARLIAVMPPEAQTEVVAEVDRRRKLMGEPYAIDSVSDDIVHGRWPR